MNKTTLVITVSRQEFLLNALLSVKNQTFKKFDIVIVVDTNIDENVLQNAMNLVDSLFNDWNENLVITALKGNGSAGYIRNAGFELAQTEWILYMDDDDELSEHAMLLMNQYINKYGNGIYSSGIYRIYKNSIKKNIPESIIWLPNKQLYQGDPLTVNSSIYFNQLQAIRKLEWEKYIFRNEMGEDLDYVMHHLLNIPFIRVPYYLYGYRDNPNSLSHRRDIDIFTERYESGYYYCLYYNSCQRLIK